MENKQSMAYWDKLVAPYKNPTIHESLLQLFSTLGFFAAICYLMYLTVDYYYPITLLLSLFAGLFVVKIFIIQHDCGHGSFFKKKKYNDMLGPLLSVFTMTPYAQWAKEHNRHHATSGNLNHRGVGDVTTWTVEEYQNAGSLQKLQYRILRNPFFLFTAGATLHFLVKQRLPFYKAKRLSSWVSVMFTNVYMLVVGAAFCYWLGAGTFFKIYLPIAFVAAVAGTWIFYIQHQYENTYWEGDKTWNYCDAALNGSSFYDLPKWLHWITGYISYHHIHHLSAKIPNYRLEKCYYSVPELQNPIKISIWESRKSFWLSLWDEANNKMVGFKDLKAA
ncbi:MAG: fatty acid desaturase [Rickettsiales bacterium]|nr:fatty acid desaturase [Pseudomonadota bacterium]MDA0967045.1 fatty acid desaturase [Pseudomonadota bacterium]MDG4542469.1 fatty acid desaturase [Rickettsiales bacterium]MDG4544973.1 fatty acid desaturase [Rickettsiales bacterium]MDG4547096.1 fatty acid desaturase [Rickettsiales bacterium]